MIKRENNSVALPIHILDDHRLTLAEIGLLANIYRWGDRGYNDGTISDQVVNMCHQLPEWSFALKNLMANGYMDDRDISKEDMETIDHHAALFLGNE